jgi:hypothetical protein
LVSAPVAEQYDPKEDVPPVVDDPVPPVPTVTTTDAVEDKSRISLRENPPPDPPFELEYPAPPHIRTRQELIPGGTSHVPDDVNHWMLPVPNIPVTGF